jgi:hypothetical protein
MDENTDYKRFSGSIPHTPLETEKKEEKILYWTKMSTEEKIDTVCQSLACFLKEKNKRYGDSALKPRNTFYKGDSTNSILIRLDDKLSRIHNGEKLKKNDVVDILGYGILLLIDQKWIDFSDLLD